MIRVGFAVTGSYRAWQGGVNYLRNLLRAVGSHPQRCLDPVLFVAHEVEDSIFSSFPPVERQRTALLDWRSPAWCCRKLCLVATGRDLMLERALRRHGIAVLSHSAPLGSRGRLPTLGWVPDFQHLHLPEFYTREELLHVDRNLRRICEQSTGLVMSSRAALEDLRRFSPLAAARAHVLHFVADPGPLDALSDRARLEECHGLHGRYFHLPNQFWAHKNHRVVIEALGRLKAAGRDVQVVCTGNPRDTRQPRFFDELQDLVRQRGIADRFRVLGLVPYGDLIGLERNAVALINPSLFEGWSTTVEEAKSLGKRIILSDLPVHREQDPPGGHYFAPHDSERLAEVMWQVWEGDPGRESALASQAQARLQERVVSFGRRFEEIVLSIGAA